MEPEALRIIAAAERFVVVDKPAGMLSVPGRNVPGGPDRSDCAAARVRAMFPGATGPLVVHRLDMETSGLMVLALDADAHRDLSRQFERREVRKEYVAIVEGEPATDQGRISLPLRLDVERRPRQVVDPRFGREAVTEWRVIGRLGGRARLSLVPLTGRTHQLRVHMADARGLGMAIVGDSLYGSATADGAEQRTAARLMLHATRLGFRVPETQQSVELVSEPPF